jgi:hypothetical protein
MKSVDNEGDDGSMDYYLEEFMRRLPHESFDFLLFRGLRALYPDMTIMDIVVCREIYTNWHDEHPSFYDEIIARLVDEKLEDLPQQFWDQYFDETQQRFTIAVITETGEVLETKDLRLFSKGEEDVKRALWKAKEHGYIDFIVDGWGGDSVGSYYIPFISASLRDDVFDALQSVRFTDIATWDDFDIEDLLKTPEGGLAELDMMIRQQHRQEKADDHSSNDRRLDN